MNAETPWPDEHADPPETIASDLFPASAEAAAAPLLDPPLDPLTSDVLTELERSPQQRTWLQSATLLAVTLVIFAMFRLFNTTPSNLLLVVGVLLFHELGHYTGMRLFNYQDVRMFFIPLFGAAVAGRSTSVQGYKEAIVLLLGPLPGIFVGGVLGIVCMFQDNALLRSAALLLLAINGFNLLPFLPLDGGRLLHLVLFSRQPHLEAVFRIVTGALLAVCGWALEAWLLAGMGIFIVFGTGFTFRVSRLARQLRGPLQAGAEMDLSARIPRELAVPLIESVRQTFPQMKQAKPLAGAVRQVWERIHLRPPGLAASLGLLALYLGSFLAVPAMAVLFNVPLRSVVAHANGDGTVARTREVRVWGRLRQATELGSDNRFHGRHIEYFPATGRVKMTGSYVNGLPDGTWTLYGEDGLVRSRRDYEHGKLVVPREPPQ